ncbi:MAG TPA: hypothetical protein VML01_06155 [Bryobacterales bacterium]|nr:hypothetical protein [Bryobacterales bacterium]
MKPEAFFRRNPKDQDGLSVFLAESSTPEECMEAFNKCHGIVSLHTGRLLDLGLQVIKDPEYPDKALIVNAPLENPRDADQEMLAGRMARSARIVRRQQRPTPATQL